ncbi:hypothetical protein [Pseudoalteromonas rubra]|uniref:Phytanoyl-CoA dioxygenase n=1 Tax=Pseudoalteromonas rubra TaxID=43658 RepID=A0A0F4QGV9_9GAMM|nr:hypothetical protein [Pseudoalteromonas rubra]KJZ06510.1 hypothetical protein TW77_18565 [Pseudoalteromonas rubra]
MNNTKEVNSKEYDFASTLDELGFIVLRRLIDENELKNVKNAVIKNAVTTTKLNTEISKLDGFHNLFETKNVKYLPMGFENEEIDNEISIIATQYVIPYLSARLDKVFSYERGGSVITLYPTELTGYKVQYHQDEAVENRKPCRLHAITPISDSSLDLIVLLEKTHNIGPLKHTLFGPLIRIDDPELEKYTHNEVNIRLEKGDILLFYTSLIHRVKDNFDSDLSHWMMRFIINH